MKLLHCGNCLDVFNLTYETKSCRCGETKGRYLPDGINAIYSGEDATPLGFANFSFSMALIRQPEEGWGERFEAFVIPKICPTFVKVEDVDAEDIQET